MRRPTEQLLDAAAHERDARRAADEHDLVDLRRVEARVYKRLAAGAERAVDNRRDERLEFRARDRPSLESRFFTLRKVPLGLNRGAAKCLHLFGADTQGGPSVFP